MTICITEMDDDDDLCPPAIYPIIHSWIKPGEAFDEENFQQLIKCIQYALKISCHSDETNSTHCLLPTIIYANRFIKKKYNTIHKDQIVEVMVACAVLSIKMMNDTGANLGPMAFLSGFTQKELVEMERNLLINLDYQLFIDPLEIETLVNVIV